MARRASRKATNAAMKTAIAQRKRVGVIGLRRRGHFGGERREGIDELNCLTPEIGSAAPRPRFPGARVSGAPMGDGVRPFSE